MNFLERSFSPKTVEVFTSQDMEFAWVNIDENIIEMSESVMLDSILNIPIVFEPNMESVTAARFTLEVDTVPGPRRLGKVAIRVYDEQENTLAYGELLFITDEIGRSEFAERLQRCHQELSGTATLRDTFDNDVLIVRYLDDGRGTVALGGRLRLSDLFVKESVDASKQSSLRNPLDIRYDGLLTDQSAIGECIRLVDQWILR